MRKIRVLLLALVVAVTMMAGSLSVFAVQGDESKASTTVPDIEKTVKIAEGVTMPATDFVFTATLADNADQVDTPAGAPASFTTTISKAAGSVTNESAPFTQAISIPSGLTAGEYTYLLEETAPTQATGDTGWTSVSTEKYYLHIYVKGDSTAQNAVLYSLTKANTVGADKVDKAAFENEYQNNDGELTVSKAVTNPEYVPADTEYTFTLTFTTNGTATAPESVKGTKGTDEVTVTNGGTFTLKKDESIKFSDLPVGVQYQVVETAPTHASYKETSIVVDGTNVSGLDTGAKKITETANSAAYTNVYDEVTITGVIMNVLPFVMMIAIAGAAAAMYVVSRRRRAAR